MWLDGLPNNTGIYWACFEEPRTKRKECGEIYIDSHRQCFRKGLTISKVYGWLLVSACPFM